MTHGPLTMFKDEIELGLSGGRRLVQEEWSHPDEKRFVDELISEGKAVATPWEYQDNFQCEVRFITGAPKP